MKNMNKQEKLALSTFTKLIRAAETINSSVHRHLADYDLTQSQFGVLEALLHLGPLCQKDLAAKILKSSGNITMVIDNLEKRGLVERKRGESDRRFFTVHLTPAGENFIVELFPTHATRIAEKMSVLDTKEQKLLGKLCRKFKLLHGK